MALDLINIALSVWLKPTILFLLILYFVRTTYSFSADSSHWILFSTLSCVGLGVPSLLVFPGLSLPILPDAFGHLTNVPVSLDDGTFLLAYKVVAIYLFVALSILFFFLASVLSIRAFCNSSLDVSDPDIDKIIDQVRAQLGISKSVLVKSNSQLSSPIIWGAHKPCLILPKNYSTLGYTRLQRVLTHELAHVKRNDWITKMAAKTACAVLWPVPLVWYLANRLEWFCELACDDVVVSTYDCRSEYAEDLLAFSRNQNHFNMVCNLIGSHIYERIDHVLDGRNQRIQLTAIERWKGFIFSLCFVFPIFLLFVTPEKTKISIPAGIDLNIIDIDSINKSTTNPVFNEGDPRYSGKIVNVRLDQDRMPEEVVVRGRIFTTNFAPKTMLDDIDKEVVDADLITFKTPRVEIQGFLPAHFVSPIYPRRALENGSEGTVMVQFDINQYGEAVNIAILESDPKRTFDRAVLNSLEKSRFLPMQIDGAPVLAKNVVENFIFKLIDESDQR